jgi:hypothetical protein
MNIYDFLLLLDHFDRKLSMIITKKQSYQDLENRHLMLYFSFLVDQYH